MIGCALAATKAKLGFILTLDKNHRIFRLQRVAGWGLHPLESAALARRTPKAAGHAQGALSTRWAAEAQMRKQDRQRSNRAARSLVRRGPVFQSSARDRCPVCETPVHHLPVVSGAQLMPTRTKVIRHRRVR